MPCAVHQKKQPQRKGKFRTERTSKEITRQLAVKKLPKHIVEKFQVASLCEVCTALDLSRVTVYRLARLGELEILTEDGTPYNAGGNPLKLLGLVCITLSSLRAYRLRHGLP